MMPIRDRYFTDPAFHTLVNCLHDFMEKGKFTPTEVREAAMLAQIKYEERNPRMVTIEEMRECLKNEPK